MGRRNTSRYKENKNCIFHLFLLLLLLLCLFSCWLLVDVCFISYRFSKLKSLIECCLLIISFLFLTTCGFWGFSSNVISFASSVWCSNSNVSLIKLQKILPFPISQILGFLFYLDCVNSMWIPFFGEIIVAICMSIVKLKFQMIIG